MPFCHVPSAQQLTHTSHYPTAMASTNQLDVVVCPVPGKSLGIILSRTIKRGSQILAEAPIFALLNNRQGAPEQRGQSLNVAVGALNGSAPTSYCGLHNASATDPRVPPTFGIFKTHCLPLTELLSDNTMGRLGVFETISRANHSSVPNAEYSWNEATGKARLFAVREIKPGEEGAVDYCGSGPSALKMEFLI